MPGRRSAVLERRDAPDRRTSSGSHLRQVKQLAFSADGKWMASNNGDRIIVWDATVPRAARELANRGDYSIHSIAFSPDSTKLAAGNMP